MHRSDDETDNDDFNGLNITDFNSDLDFTSEVS